jgi:hypothetical protein
MIAGAMFETPMTLMAPGAPEADISSNQASCSAMLAARPPYSVGQAGAAHPASAMVRFQFRRISMLPSSNPPPAAAASTTAGVRLSSSQAENSAPNAPTPSSRSVFTSTSVFTRLPPG